jgi:hypothetical protein
MLIVKYCIILGGGTLKDAVLITKVLRISRTSNKEIYNYKHNYKYKYLTTHI